MRDSTYSVLETLIDSPKTWTDLKNTTNLTDGGLQKVLKEMIKMRMVEQVLVGKESGFKEKRYAITARARKERIYEKAKDLKESLERLR